MKWIFTIISLLSIFLALSFNADALNCSLYDNYKYYKYPKMTNSDWQYLQNYIDETGNDLRNYNYIDNGGATTFQSGYGYYNWSGNSDWVLQNIIENTSWELWYDEGIFPEKGFEEFARWKKRGTDDTYGSLFIYVLPPSNTTALLVIQYNEQLFIRTARWNSIDVTPLTVNYGCVLFVEDNEQLMVRGRIWYSDPIGKNRVMNVIWKTNKYTPTLMSLTHSNYFKKPTSITFNPEIRICSSENGYAYSTDYVFGIKCPFELFSSYLGITYDETNSTETYSNHTYYNHMFFSDTNEYSSCINENFTWSGDSFDHTPIALSNSDAIALCEQAQPEETALNIICDIGSWLTGSPREGGCLILSLFIIAIAVSIIGGTLTYSEIKMQREISNKYLLTGGTILILLVMLMFVNMVDLLTGIVSFILVIALMIIFEERTTAYRGR